MLWVGCLGRTVQACVVGFDVGLFDGAVFNDQGVTLGAIASEDGGAVKGEIQGARKGQRRVA